MIRFLVMLAVALQPAEVVLRDQVDRIEVNHVHDRNGDHVFSQVIFWQSGDVRTWRLLKVSGRPVRSRCGWRLRWLDGDTIRQVDADTSCESWTQHDPELSDRERLPADRRRPLSPEFRTLSP